MPRDTDHPVYAVREPFPGKITGTEITYGVLDRYHPLTITSRKTDNGVIFINGIEADFQAFDSGATATIGIANRQARILYDENHLHRR